MRFDAYKLYVQTVTLGLLDTIIRADRERSFDLAILLCFDEEQLLQQGVDGLLEFVKLTQEIVFILLKLAVSFVI